MCGIAGYIDFSKNSSLDILQNSTRTMAHRGPDGEGYFFKETTNATIGLGHRRLSIIDLSHAADQPMNYKNLTIVFNGEIYNYKEIKQELENKGHSFNTTGDTEVILHAYEEWGQNCLQKFIGMFAFVIFDSEKQEVFCVRDRAGVKPFFYYWDNSIFIFASELKAIVAHPAFQKKINLSAVGAFLQYGYVPSPHCIYENTQKILPGYYLSIHLSNKILTNKQYWNVYDCYNAKKLDISFNDAVLETEKLLSNAFQYRMVSDVPVGVFLSGGYDSSCVTAILQKNSTEKIKTFTIGVPDAGLNEAPYAKDIAAHLGTDHTEYYCTHNEALEIIPQLPFFYDEPFADSSAIPTTLVSQIARKKVTVALSADAGDEVFAGYNRYDYVTKYGGRIQKIPAPLRKLFSGVMELVPSNKIPILKNKYLFNSRYEKIKQLFKNPSNKNILQTLSQQYNINELNQLLIQNIDSLNTLFDSNELLKENFDILSYMMAIDYQTYLVDDILTKVDRATMSVSLEGREPFLDQRIIEWAARLPIQFKYNNGNKKYILKEITHKYIPHQLLNRPKMGFGIPIAEWLEKDLKKYVDYYFDKNFIIRQNIFKPEEINKIYKGFYSGKRERAEKIWYLLMFQMWYDKWMNNN